MLVMKYNPLIIQEFLKFSEFGIITKFFSLDERSHALRESYNSNYYFTRRNLIFTVCKQVSVSVGQNIDVYL